MTNENYAHYSACQIRIGYAMLMAAFLGATIRQCESHARYSCDVHLSVV
jgi:hypothetical protein